jgi:hypothetical protein
MDLLTDEELERLAAQDGPESLAARVLVALRDQRAQDKQVFAFRLGEYYVIGPMPDAETELTMTLINEVAKKLKKAERGE